MIDILIESIGNKIYIDKIGIDNKIVYDSHNGFNDYMPESIINKINKIVKERKNLMKDIGYITILFSDKLITGLINNIDLTTNYFDFNISYSEFSNKEKIFA